MEICIAIIAFCVIVIAGLLVRLVRNKKIDSMTDKEKLKEIKKLADSMYYAAMYLTTDASRLHKAMEDYHQFFINEYHKEEPTIPDIVDEHYWEILGVEPANDDLKQAIHDAIFDLDERKGYTSELTDMFMAGFNYQKQQMMRNAIEGDITFDYYGNDDKTYGCIAHNSFCLEDFGLKDRDKVKVIIIKED